MCFVWISAKAAFTSINSISQLVFITETVCAYCAVRTQILNIVQLIKFYSHQLMH